ncbi:MAG TPA: hypothetical protein VGO55_17515 [Allosphingosinicella sp.]|jgi:hypothetical protein|nr:hypothetical protein [Allosphingosinicella sp.]
MRSSLFGVAAGTAALALAACGAKSPSPDGKAAETTQGAVAPAPPATIMAATPALRAEGRAVEAVIRSAYAAPNAGAVDPNIFVDETGAALRAAAPGQIHGDYRYDGAAGPEAPPTFYGVNVTGPASALVNVDHKLNGAEAHTRWDLCKLGGRWRVRDVNSVHTFTVRQSLRLPLQGGC